MAIVRSEFAGQESKRLRPPIFAKIPSMIAGLLNFMAKLRTPLRPRLCKTATGRMQLVFSNSCPWHQFPRYANAVVRQYSLTLVEQMDTFYERLWIAKRGGQEFSISWDDLIPEVTVMAWGQTPDQAVTGLVGVEQLQKQADGGA